MFTLGEGWHNYHHTFPFDYKAAELPYYFNLTTILIDLCAKIGWAYDLKLATPEVLLVVHLSEIICFRQSRRERYAPAVSTRTDSLHQAYSVAKYIEASCCV